jgi:O-succinylhomoserine sulfhydrylase
MNAWLLLKSLEMLELRVRAADQTARQLATWLQHDPRIGRVFYTGLSNHGQHALVRRQQTGHGGVLSFEVGTGKDDAWRLIDSLKLISIATNIGDTRTMITHPASTTHGRLQPEEKRLAGITDKMVRLPVGLEHVGVIMTDIDTALMSLPMVRDKAQIERAIE